MMPWYGWLILICVLAACATAVLISRMMANSMSKMLEDDRRFGAAPTGQRFGRGYGAVGYTRRVSDQQRKRGDRND